MATWKLNKTWRVYDCHLSEGRKENETKTFDKQENSIHLEWYKHTQRPTKTNKTFETEKPFFLKTKYFLAINKKKSKSQRIQEPRLSKSTGTKLRRNTRRPKKKMHKRRYKKHGEKFIMPMWNALESLYFLIPPSLQHQSTYNVAHKFLLLQYTLWKLALLSFFCVTIIHIPFALNSLFIPCGSLFFTCGIPSPSCIPLQEPKQHPFTWTQHPSENEISNTKKSLNYTHIQVLFGEFSNCGRQRCLITRHVCKLMKIG